MFVKKKNVYDTEWVRGAWWAWISPFSLSNTCLPTRSKSIASKRVFITSYYIVCDVRANNHRMVA